MLDGYDHLNAIPFEEYVNAKPKILIGLDNPHLLTTNETKVENKLLNQANYDEITRDDQFS